MPTHSECEPKEVCDVCKKPMKQRIPKLNAMLLLIIPISILWYAIWQFETYTQWVKKYTADSYESCRIFEKDKEGEADCIKYMRGGNYAPYPFWKAVVLINPSK